MNRTEFMKQLEALLQNISSAEREEALQYYNDYFDDAGPENEKSVIESLGNPAKVAENIKRDLCLNGYGDNVHRQAKPSDKAVIPYEHEEGNTHNKGSAQAAAGNRNAGPANQSGGLSNPGGGQANQSGGQGNQSSTTSKSAESRDKLPTGVIVLLIVLGVLASPAILSVAGGILGVLVGLIVSWFALILGFGISAVAFLIVFVVLLVAGVMILVSDIMAGVCVIGIGMLCGGLGILLMMLTVAMAGIATPAIFGGAAELIKKLFDKKG